MTQNELDELRELDKKAAPGPWMAENILPDLFVTAPDGTTICFGRYCSQSDFDFIAASRSAVPALLDHIDVLQKALELACTAWSTEKCMGNPSEPDQVEWIKYDADYRFGAYLADARAEPEKEATHAD